MATTSKRLELEYIANTTGVRKGLSDIGRMHSSFASGLRRFGSQLSSIGSSMTTTLTLPLVAFGVVAANQFTEAAQASAQTQAVIESTGGAAGVTAEHVADLAQEMADMAVVDDEAVQAAENLLLTFRNLRNEVGAGNDIFDQATAATLDAATAMGKDYSSAAVMVGKALNDPIRGLSALSRIGVAFDDQQREQIEAFMDANDVMGAQKIILAELQAEFGGSAEAAGKAAGPLQKMRVTFENLAEQVGEFVIPLFEQLTAWVQRVSRWFGHLTDEQRKLVVKIGAVVAAAGPLLIVFGKLARGAGSLISVFGRIGRLLGGGGAAGGAGLAAGFGALATQAGFAAIAIAGAAAAYKILTHQDPSFTPKLSKDVAQLIMGSDELRDSLGLTALGVQALKERAGSSGKMLDLFAERTLEAADATRRQKSIVANTLATMDKYGLELNDSAQYTLDAYLATGNMRGAIELLRRTIRGAVLVDLKNYADVMGTLAANTEEAREHFVDLRAQYALGLPDPWTGGNGNGNNGNGNEPPSPPYHPPPIILDRASLTDQLAVAAATRGW